jgi:hypothetical protein
MAAAGLTVGVSVAFNYFRFGTFFNGSYASKLNIVPSFRLHLSFFMGMWFSPNGGLAFFWPSFMLLYIAVFAAVLLGIARNKFIEPNSAPPRRSLRYYFPLLTISAILFLLTAGFSKWYTPLGGFAWGPRFMLPWIPAMSLLLVYFYRVELTGLLRFVLIHPVGFVLGSLLVVSASLPQFSILFGEFVLAKIFAYPECPHVPVIQEGAAYYYQCLQTQIWPRTLMISELYSVALKSPVLWFSILYGVVLVGGLHFVRRRLSEDESSSKAASAIKATLANSFAMLRSAIERPVPHCVFVVAFYSLVFLAFFFPAIYSGSLLAVDGDGLLIYLPNFHSHKVLWDTLLLSGFPMMADPQVMTWYPPAFLLSLLPGSWNVFMIVAYVVGSSFMYGYVHTLTRSRFAALTSGLIFGLSGFMIAHLGHAVIVHAAAWLPLIIWSLEMLRRRLSARWLLIGTFAVTLCFLAGQPQIFFYGLTMSGAYAIVLGGSAAAGRWRYLSTSFLMVVLGLGLAAVQFIPTTELSGQGLLNTHNFERFIAFSLPPRQALNMIFPFVFGGQPLSGVWPYFGAPYQTEVTGYVGLFSLMLVAFGVVITRKRALAWFWLCVALLAFLLAMGDATPLARLLFHIPIVSNFRAPARHLLEMTFAFSVLSGLGVAAVVQRKVSARLLRRVIVIAGLAMIVCVILLFISSSYVAALAAAQHITQVSLLPWKNRAVGVPLIIFPLAMGVLAYWYRQPSSVSRRMLVLIVLVIDLGSFGWFYEWRYAATDKSALIAPESANRYRSSLDATNQRLMPYRGARGTTAEMPPNLSRLWGVPSANGYNVLILSRMGNLLRMIDYTGVPLPWNEPNDQSLSVTAVRFLVLPHDEVSKDESGVSWFQENAEFWIGESCGEPPQTSAKLVLPAPVRSTALAVVSRLACSTQIPDGAEVIRLRLSDSAGHVQVRSLRAGHDSSEWAYDCSSVRPGMRHQRAQIFSSYPAQMYDQPCEGHYYVTTLKLDGASEIKSVDFEWVGGPGGAIIIDKLTLMDEPAGTSTPIDSALMGSNGWRLVEETEGARVYENLRAMPRAWLAPEVVKVDPNQALEAIKTGRLPDGRVFDPSQIALIEAPLVLNSQDADSKASASIASLSATQMEVRTKSTRAGFLVTSDAYYPGWRASIDGRDVWLYRADYAIRGVMVPAGEHTVRFDYRPRSFYLGAGVSLISMLLLIALAVGARSFRVGASGTR